MADYTTPQKVRDSIDSIVAGTQDEVLARLITAVSRQIDRYCNRPDGFVALSAATARVYAGSGEPYLFIDECVAITGVGSKASPDDTTYNAWTSADWIAFSGDPLHPNFNRLPYTGLLTAPAGDYALFISGVYTNSVGWRVQLADQYQAARNVPTIQVTAKWGYAVTVPADIEQACIIQIARLFKRGQSAFQDSVANADFGTLMYRRGVDPEVEFILKQGRYVVPTL